MMFNACKLLIHEDIEAMKVLCRRSAVSVSPFVEEIVRYSLQFSGKCLRPALLFLAGRVFGSITDQHIRGAAAIELIHTATLIHDDILDGAAIRRHLETVNLRWNTQIGVLAGDLMLSKALELIADGNDIYGIQRITKACKKTVEGELRQIDSIGNYEMGLDDYRTIIRCKTAALLACSAELGAYYSGAASADIETFRLFGEKAGTAFQMVDDILDIAGQTHRVGKTLQTDLTNRKPTLPVILYLQNVSSEAERLSMLRQLSSQIPDIASVIETLETSGTIEQAKNIARQEIEEAVRLLDKVNGSCQALDALKEMASFVIERNT